MNVCSVTNPWLSNHQLLHSDAQGVPRCYDLTTRTDLPVRSLEKFTRPDQAMDVEFFSASPRGGWVMSDEGDGEEFRPVNVDGRVAMSSPAFEGSWAFWCAGGHRWLQIYTPKQPRDAGRRAILHDALTPRRRWPEFALPRAMARLDILRVVTPEKIVAWKPEVTLGAAGNARYQRETMAYRLPNTLVRVRRSRVQEISVWSLKHAAPLRHWTVTLPANVGAIAVSPRGDRIAWVLNAPSLSQHGLRLARAALWVSALDGRDLRGLGVVELRADAQYPKMDWSPNGKKLSYVKNDALWVTAVR
ncbi:hypothetical protein CCAX7_56060 [Capsulimonas corticalis]|uniref:Uncharacterized protein n=1 Tax=Capsulimonas corticalis TaxID=2219043 RepID=A0A402D0N1_9BACT|nr:hypothetical protein CCAX7_56060 [Capsulimonas corticalis]